MTDYKLGPVKAWVASAANELGNLFGIKVIGGWRNYDANGYPDHPTGHAIDLMTTTGDALAEYAREHAKRLGIKYIVWNRRVWSQAKADQGWRPYTGTSNPHTDHVHITFNPAAPVGGAITGVASNVGTNALTGLFNIDELMGKIRGTSITLVAALLGVSLVAAGLIIAVRRMPENTIKNLL
jgi:hypothetical protein